MKRRTSDKWDDLLWWIITKLEDYANGRARRHADAYKARMEARHNAWKETA